MKSRDTDKEHEMNLMHTVIQRAKAVPEVLWQISAAPAQAVRGRGQQRTGLPFLAAVTGTAALGLVDWPVALLVAGGYLLVHRQPNQPEPVEATGTTDQPRLDHPPVAHTPPESAPGPAPRPYANRPLRQDLQPRQGGPHLPRRTLRQGRRRRRNLGRGMTR